MDNCIKEFKESDIVKNMLKDYINKLIIYLEQDYELQDYIFVGYKIKYRIEQSFYKIKFTLVFPNDFVYEFGINLNIDDLPFINSIAIDIKYTLIE